ncbi:MAG: DUF262 domain-containing protein [Pseudomonadota bacterium]
MKNNKPIEIEAENNEIDSISHEKIEPKDIDITAEQNSLSTIIGMIEDNAIDMNTEFQRSGNLWPETTMIRLIESILLRFPIPAFYFDASDDEKWLVVDGLQRLWSLKRFVVDKDLTLKELSILTDLEDKNYEQLSSNLRRKMDRYQVTTYLIKPGTPKKVKYEIFNRINTGGLVLTKQEIRHVLNQEKPANYLKGLVEDNRFKAIINVTDQRMQARELILRYLAFSNTPYTKYEPPFPSFLDKAMEQLYQIQEKKLVQLKTNLWRALETCQKLFEQHIFSRSIHTGKRQLNGALFEVWTVLIGQLNEQEIKRLVLKKDRLITQFKSHLNDKKFSKSISQISSKSSVTMRFKTIESMIEEILNDH